MILTFVFSLDTYGQGKNKLKGPASWAPAHDYRATTIHIYFPEQNVYYDLQEGVYISLSADNWQVSASLPSIISGVDLSIVAKVEFDLSSDGPQKYNSEHKIKNKGKGKSEKDKSKDKANKDKSEKN